MATTNPISNARGTISSNAITTIYTVPGGKLTKVTNIKFSPSNNVTPYSIIFLIGYSNGNAQIPVYNKSLDGGDSINDDSLYILGTGMSLAVQVNISGLINYTIIGEEITL